VQNLFNAAKKIDFFLLLFVVAAVASALRREFLPQAGLLSATVKSVGSLRGYGLLISGVIVAAVAFWCCRQPNSQD